jgi:hypothetical protein
MSRRLPRQPGESELAADRAGLVRPEPVVDDVASKLYWSGGYSLTKGFLASEFVTRQLQGGPCFSVPDAGTAAEISPDMSRGRL